MRHIYIILLAGLIAGCNFTNIEIKGTAPGWENATVSIKNSPSAQPLYAANIEAEKFIIVQQPIKEVGYYQLCIEPSGRGKVFPQYYEVYLEPGKYNVKFQTGRNQYPLITSESAIQNDLTAYHRFTDSVMNSVRAENDKWVNQLNDPKAFFLPDKQYQAILANVKLWQDKLANAATATLATFVEKNPHNQVIPHAMAGMNIEGDPGKYYAIYQKLGDDVKNSDDGKEIGDKLKAIVKLVPGAMAPEFAGLTPDGKKINVKDLHKKVILVEFWRSGSSMGKQEHYGLVNNILPNLDGTKVGVIGVSFDTDRTKWLETIKKHKLYWPQVSDLKGDESQNAKNWNITQLPNYYILDGEGRVLYTELSYQGIAFSINEYLSKH